MKKVFFTLIFSCFFVCYAKADSQSAKYEKECLSIVNPPKVEITSSYGKLHYNFNKDKEYLRKETAKRFEEMGKDFSDSFTPVGLTKVRDAFDFNLVVGRIDVSNGYTCFYPESIKIHLGYYTPTIYVLNTLKKDSCLYDLALRHEKTHMQIYIEALDYFLPQLKTTTEGLFAAVGVMAVKRGDAGEQAAKKLNDAYLAAVQKKVDAWRKDVEKEQLKLDTPEHYIIENKLCQEISGEDETF